MSPIKRRSASGFTLIELLIATALFFAAAATTAVFMAQGVRLFSKLIAAGQEESAAVCVIKMSRDVRNLVDCSLIPFEPKEDRLAFASLEDRSTIEGEPDPWPFGVVYRYDAETFRIVREARRPQTFERPEATRTETMLDGVRSLTFEYEGNPGQIPWRVTVNIEYQGKFGLRTLSQDIWVPVAPAPAADQR